MKPDPGKKNGYNAFPRKLPCGNDTRYASSRRVRQRRAIFLCVFFLTTLLGLTILLSSCAAQDYQSANETQTGLSLTLMDPYDVSTESELAGNRFTALKEEWLAAHPEIQLEETVIRPKDYSSVISEYASQNYLPDIFLIPANNIDLWSDWGLLADVPEYENTTILSAPVLVAYDTELWYEAGQDSFPKTWEDLAEINEHFLTLDYDSALGVPTLSGWNTTLYLMPRIFAENCGTAWLNRMISGDESCIFLEDGVINALEELSKITDSNVLTGYTSPVEAYLENRCPAAVITLNDLPRIQNSDKNNRTAFALLPVSEKSLYGSEIAGTYSTVESYVLVINAKVTEDPEKLRLCVNFCNFITDANKDEMAADSRINSLLSDADEIPNFVYDVNISAVNSISGALQTWLNTAPEHRVPEEITNAMQNGYEKYNETS